jgi:O-antigen/teichoic acid export membrane protein
VFFLQDGVLIGLRSAQWVPLENSLYSVFKLILLLALAASLPGAGLFLAWNAPVGLAVALVNVLIFGRLIPGQRKQRSDLLPDRRRVLSVAVGNYGGTLFSIAGLTLLPILVTDRTSATQTAYFYVPWMIAAGLQLIALNMMMSLTVEGALDEPQLRGLFRKAFLHTSRLVLPLALALALGAPWVLRAFGSHYAHAGAPLLRLLAAGMLPNVLVALAIGVARVQHRGMTVLGIEGARAVLVIGLSIVLLPSVGIEGVGIAWLVAQLAVAGVLLAGMLRPLLAPAR